MRSTREKAITGQSKGRKSAKITAAAKTGPVAAKKKTTEVVTSRQAPAILGAADRRCPECAFCSWYQTDSGIQMPFCENPETKDFAHPIGWLHASSPACELFQIRNSKRVSAPIGIQSKPDEKETNWHEQLLKYGALASFLVYIIKTLLGESADLFSNIGN